jgi:protein-S-isoprenylcysteine O-methyltransferase Ste14
LEPGQFIGFLESRRYREDVLMPSRATNPRIVEKLQGFARAASITVVLVGCLVFIGWILDIGILKSVLPGLVTMKANTALCFILAGAALWLLRTAGETRETRVP